MEVEEDLEGMSEAVEESEEEDADEFFTNILDDEIPDDEILKELDKLDDNDDKEDE